MFDIQAAFSEVAAKYNIDAWGIYQPQPIHSWHESAMDEPFFRILSYDFYYQERRFGRRLKLYDPTMEQIMAGWQQLLVDFEAEMAAVVGDHVADTE